MIAIMPAAMRNEMIAFFQPFISNVSMTNGVRIKDAPINNPIANIILSIDTSNQLLVIL